MMTFAMAILAEAADETTTGGDGNMVVLILLVVGFSALMMVMARRRVSKRGASVAASRRSRSAASGADAAAGRYGIHKSMQQLLLELEELSREINSQVDTRLRALNILIQEADEKIRDLRRLQGIAGDRPEPVEHLPTAKAEPHGDETRERYAQVYALAEKGSTVVEIAQEIGLMSGEVELILALRRTASHSAEGQA
jgi:uncharacterized protein HemX